MVSGKLGILQPFILSILNADISAGNVVTSNLSLKSKRSFRMALPARPTAPGKSCKPINCKFK